MRIRRIIQIATFSDGTLIVLCNDGTVWHQAPLTFVWMQINIKPVTESIA